MSFLPLQWNFKINKKLGRRPLHSSASHTLEQHVIYSPKNVGWWRNCIHYLRYEYKRISGILWKENSYWYCLQDIGSNSSLWGSSHLPPLFAWYTNYERFLHFTWLAKKKSQDYFVTRELYAKIKCQCPEIKSDRHKTHVLSTAASIPLEQSWVATAETRWPAEQTMPTIW